jgi:thiol:disulfide interchange protein DsbA
MKRILITLLALAATATATAQSGNWVAGKHYVVIPAQRTNVPAGKVEVLEVFSFGCPACNAYRAEMKRIQAGLPKNAQVSYLHASFNAAENWPTFQRAYVTAQTLGVPDKTQDAMYDAIWTSGELGIIDNATGRLKRKMPGIEDIARFYERVAGVKAADFVNASKSFGVDLKIRQAEAQLRAMQIYQTPTIVVAGKYRIENNAMRDQDVLELIKFLVAKESGGVKPAAPAPAAKKP